MTFRVLLALSTLVGALVSGALEASAREVIFGVEQSLTGDSNLFTTQSGNNQADGSYRVGPTVRLRQQRKELNYDLFYAPNYQVYMKTDGIDGWNQDFGATLDYLPTPRDRVSMSARATLNRFVSVVPDETTGAAGVTAVGLGDQGLYLVDLTYERSVTERTTAFVGGTYNQWTFSSPLNTPNVSGTGRVGGNYAVHPRFSLGLDVQGTYRKFQETIFFRGTTSYIANSNLLANWRPAPNVLVSGSIGPSWVRQIEDEFSAPVVVDQYLTIPASPTNAALFEGCDTFLSLATCDVYAPATNVADLNTATTTVDFPPGVDPPSAESDFVTFFARFLVSRTWQRTDVRLIYDRTQDATGGTNQTQLADSVAFAASYRPFDRTVFSFSVRYTSRRADATRTRVLPTAVRSGEFRDGGSPANPADELASPGPLQIQTFDDRSERREVSLTAAARRNVTRNLRVAAELTYVGGVNEFRSFNVDANQQTVNTRARFDRVLGRVLLTYEFDPYRF